jgi:heme-degrading monooxygenase HmoA
MAVMVIMESRGNTEQLLAATDEIRRRSGKPDGLLVRVVAAADEGIVLVHVWTSEQARAAWHTDEAHRSALAASGIAGLTRERTVREYTTDTVQIFEPTEGDR